MGAQCQSLRSEAAGGFVMNLIGKRKIWYSISLIMIVPGVVALVLWGLRLGIDFNAGELSTVKGHVTLATANKATAGLGFNDVTVVASGPETQIRFRDPAPQKEHEANRQK